MPDHSSSNIAYAFYARSVAQPDEPALVFKDATYSYAMLRDLISSFTLKLREEGIGENASIQIRSTDLAICLAATLAASRIGARVIERAITTDFQTGFQISHVLSESTDEGPWKNIVVDACFSPDKFGRKAKDEVWKGSYPDPCNPWLILTTSGTTGTPKALALSQDLVMRRSSAVQDDLGADGSRIVLLYPSGSRPFFARALAVLNYGGALVANSDWEFWHQSRVSLVSGSLSQARKLTNQVKSTDRLPRIEVIGEKVELQEIDDLLLLFECVDDTFGASEVSKSHSNVYTSGPNGRVCQPRQWADAVEIVDVNGATCPPGTEGRLRIRSSNVVIAYLADRANLPTTIDGWFYSGDVARWKANGELDVLYRENEDVLTVGGSKINARIIDSQIVSLDGILSAAVFISPKLGSNDLIAFAVFEDGVNRMQLAEHARIMCKEKLGAQFVPVRIWPLDNIPRKLSGAVDREACSLIIQDAIGADHSS